MMILTSLLPNPLFYELKLILHRREKCDRAQTSASPPEQASSIRSGNFGNLFAGCHMNFCNFISNVRNECRFIALASMWDGGKKGCIRFDKQPFERQLADDLTLFFGVFVRHRTGNTNVEIESNGFLCCFKVSVERMKYTGFFCDKMTLLLQILMPFGKDCQQVNGCLTQPGILLLSHVNDDRFMDGFGKRELSFQGFHLKSTGLAFFYPIIVNPDLAYCYNSGVSCQGFDFIERFFRKLIKVSWMEPHC